MNDKVKEWIRKANNDLKTAELILSANLFDMVCFHTQQAGEKYLKAILESLNKRIPRTHDLDYLCDCLEDSGMAISDNLREAAGYLTGYGVDSRYPGFESEKAEAEDAIQYARVIREWAMRIL